MSPLMPASPLQSSTQNCGLQRRRDFIRHGLTAAAALATFPSRSQAAASAGYQLGCYTRPWDAYPFEVALDGIADAGFRYAGLMTAKGRSWVIITVDSSPEDVARIADAVKARHLETLSIYGGDFPVAQSLEAGIAGLRRLIDHCVICRCPNLMLGGTAAPTLFEAYYKAVAECCDYAREKGVGLSIKPHGGSNATGPQCRRIIEQIGHPNFRLWYDPGNIFYYSDGALDPVDDATTVDGIVVGMSVKDFLPPKEVLLTPGTGRVDFPKVLAALQNGGFTFGPVLVECLAKGDAASVTAEARKARRYLEDLLSR
jgi:sugar phosphate isomerase/epimerase